MARYIARFMKGVLGENGHEASCRSIDEDQGFVRRVAAELAKNQFCEVRKVKNWLTPFRSCSRERCGPDLEGARYLQKRPDISDDQLSWPRWRCKASVDGLVSRHHDLQHMVAIDHSRALRIAARRMG